MAIVNGMNLDSMDAVEPMKLYCLLSGWKIIGTNGVNYIWSKIDTDCPLDFCSLQIKYQKLLRESGNLE
jgi:hypothetical protein